MIGRVYAGIRAELMSGALVPRQRLRVATLAGAHGVSLNVVREALSRLAGEGLVDTEPNCGFSVRGLSADDLVDLVAQRVMLETLALRRCIAHSSSDWQAAVLAAHHRLSKTPVTDAEGALHPQWIARHDDFHRVMLEACGSPRLFQMIRQLADAAELYQRALLPLSGRDEEMEQEHQQLLEAILAEQAEKAVGVLQAHLEKTRDVMLSTLKLSDRTLSVGVLGA